MSHPSDILAIGAGPTAPSPPWFKCPDTLTILRVVIKNKQGGLVELPFVKYALLDNTPMILGTKGCEEAIYGHKLKVLPAPPLPWMTTWDDGELDLLVTNYPFNFALNTALFRMGDPSVLRDIYRFHQAYPCLMALKQEGKSL